MLDGELEVVALIGAEEGVGEVGLAQRRSRLGRRSLRLLAPVLVRLVPRLRLRGMGEEDRFFLGEEAQALVLPSGGATYPAG